MSSLIRSTASRGDRSRAGGISANAEIVGPHPMSVPGRIRPSASSSRSAHWRTSSGSNARWSSASRSASSRRRPPRISCPATTIAFQSDRSRPANAGNRLTSADSPTNPRANAQRPTVAVVATPPRAPISQIPSRPLAISSIQNRVSVSHHRLAATTSSPSSSLWGRSPPAAPETSRARLPAGQPLPERAGAQRPAARAHLEERLENTMIVGFATACVNLTRSASGKGPRFCEEYMELPTPGEPRMDQPARRSPRQPPQSTPMEP